MTDREGKPWKDAHGNPQYEQVCYSLQVTADITKDECYEQPIPTDFKTKKEFLDWFRQERCEHAEDYDVGEEIQYYTPGKNGCPDIDTLKGELDTIKEVYGKSVAVVEAIQNSRDMDVASRKVGKQWHEEQYNKTAKQIAEILETLHEQGFKQQETKKILKEDKALAEQFKKNAHRKATR